MDKGFQFFPDQASTFSNQVDLLFYFLVALTVFFVAIIFLLIYLFMVKYRRRSEEEIPAEIPGYLKLEVLWSAIPFGLAMLVFVWGAKLYFDVYTPPNDALEVYVVGKQWMWHIQHPNGVREINELHVPTGRTIRLVMATEDVIHSFFIPAFRLKKDVVPGRFSSFWFEATKPGEYHLFCAEYCGTKHSEMKGRVVVMEPIDYQNWLSANQPVVNLAALGENRFQQLGCVSCHGEKNTAKGPSLYGLFGATVQLEAGGSVTADENYIRESILNPNAKITAGYKSTMPTYQGQVSEAMLLEMLFYVKSLGAAGRGAL